LVITAKYYGSDRTELREAHELKFGSLNGQLTVVGNFFFTTSKSFASFFYFRNKNIARRNVNTRFLFYAVTLVGWQAG
jgi:hypothetical protein